MNRLSRTLIAIVLVMMVISCGQYERESPPAEAAPAAVKTGPDPTVVDANHYKTEFENERVRVVRIKYGPGEGSVMHYHPEAVAVYLTDNVVEMELPDGSTVEERAEAGKHDFTPAGQHLPRNAGNESLELVLVELKPQARATGAADTGADPTLVDADHYKTELENERVRLVRISYGPGEESVMHHHPDSVAVFLTEHHVEMRMPDGSTQEIHAKAGEHAFIPAGQHLPRNIGAKAWELVLVELKGS